MRTRLTSCLAAACWLLAAPAGSAADISSTPNPSNPSKPSNPPDAALLAAAQASKPALLRELAALVDIDSGTDDAAGLARVRAVLVQRLEQLGAAVSIADAAPAAGKTVIGTLTGSGKRKLMLMIHYDTVFGAGEAARRPFRIDGTRAYGPGVADAKGGALLILHALQLARQRGWRDYRTLTVVFNPDEEKSSLGSRATIRALSAEQDAVLIFEPPDAERVIIATNGIAYVQLQVQGLASHAGSAPERGRNAALELAYQLVRLKDLGDAAKGTSVNWTRMQAGDKVNVIPDQASATADMRFADPAEPARVQRDADAVVRGATLVPGAEARVMVENRRPPFGRNADTDRLAALAVRVYAELGKRIEPTAMRYSTDAGFAWQGGGSVGSSSGSNGSGSGKAAGPAVLDGLGIVGDRLHSADEWADLDSIAPRLYLAVRMLELLGSEN
jgi:glutamate carboxypeptidase